jgi:hypothetical protein
MKRKLKASTVEKFCDVFIHLGEASIIGGGATLFVKGLVSWAETLAGVGGGIFIVLWGLYIYNKYGE